MSGEKNKPDAVYYVLGIVIVLFVILMLYKYKERLSVSAPERTVSSYVMHYADWCPACKAMKPIWEKVTKELTDIEYTMNDVQKNPMPSITAIPTIIRHNIDGTEEIYNGGHSEDRLRAFLSAV